MVRERMGRQSRQNAPSSWEPEPLQLPLEAPRERNRRSDDEIEPDEELPGSHVIVIDLG